MQFKVVLRAENLCSLWQDSSMHEIIPVKISLDGFNGGYSIMWVYDLSSEFFNTKSQKHARTEPYAIKIQRKQRIKTTQLFFFFRINSDEIVLLQYV